MDIPILIITYRRFDLVLQILGILAQEGMKNVYLSVDDYKGNAQAFQKVLNYLQQHAFNYKILEWEENVGCDKNVIEGINWFFSQNEHGIILEDDCIPTEVFGLLATRLKTAALSKSNVSLFSIPMNNTTGMWRPAYLPIFWGWYTNKNYFREFYRFYHEGKMGLSGLKALWSRPVSTRIKLISLMNYFSHRSGRKGVAWDSVLFSFLLLKNHTFLVPPASGIRNEGFGDQKAVYTHTIIAPSWYKDVTFYTGKEKLPVNIGVHDPVANNGFLDKFFGNYPANLLKLIATTIKSYFASYRRLKRHHR
jgi:hypothetical protein